MKPLLYLHVGLHKTGTTTIQKWFYLNRKNVLSSGIFYPDYYCSFKQKKAISSHHRLARSVIDVDPLLSQATGIQSIQDYCFRAARDNQSVLISSENISTLGQSDQKNDVSSLRREKYIDVLSKALEGFRVVPVLILREHIYYHYSFFTERIRNIYAVDRYIDFGDYLRARVKEEELFFLGVADRLNKTFGCLKACTFENLLKSGLIAGFTELIGLDVVDNADNLIKVGNERPGLCPMAIEVKKVMARHIADAEKNTIFNNILLSSEFLDMSKSLGFNITKEQAITMGLVGDVKTIEILQEDRQLVFEKYNVHVPDSFKSTEIVDMMKYKPAIDKLAEWCLTTGLDSQGNRTKNF